MPVAISPQNTIITPSLSPDGIIHSIAVDPDTGVTYFGGNFQSWGKPVGAGIPVDITTGLPASPWPPIRWATGFNLGRGTSWTNDFDVMCAAPDGTGGWYVGGAFRYVGNDNIFRSCVAHINSDGTLDTNFNAGLITNSEPPTSSSSPGVVSCMAYVGGSLGIGGSFRYVNGVRAQNFAVLDGTTGTLQSFDFEPNGDVWAISSDGLFVGGEFSEFGGVTRRGLVKFSSVFGAVDTSWDANLSSGADVYSLHRSGNLLAVGGSFTTAGGSNRRNVAVIDITTALPTACDPYVSSSVYSVYLDSVLYAGGAFTSVNTNTVPTTRNYIASFDLSSGVVTSFNPNADDDVYSIAVSGSTVYAGGAFGNIGGATRWQLAALDGGTGTAASWDPHPSNNSTIRTVVISGTQVFVGGNFQTMNATTTGGVAGMDTDGNIIIFANGPFGDPYFSVYQVLVTDVAGTTRVALAASFEGAALHATDGSMIWQQSNVSDIYAVARPGNTGNLYIGGNFSSADGHSTDLVALLSIADGTVDTSFSMDFVTGDEVLTMTSSPNNSGTLFIAGNFSLINSAISGLVPVSNAARIDTAGNAYSWSPLLPESVRASLVSADDSTVYLCPNFNGEPHQVYGVDFDSGVITKTLNLTSAVWNICYNGDNTRLYVVGVGGSQYSGAAEVIESDFSLTNWLPALKDSVMPNGQGSEPDIEAVAYNPITNRVIIGGGMSGTNAVFSPWMGQFIVPKQVNIVGKDATTGDYLPLSSTDTATNTSGNQIFGDTGIRGITGIMGSTGYSLQGATGFAGLPGATGLLGAQGLTGLAATGFFGITGFFGDTGLMPDSTMGETGISGVTGLVGRTGIFGIQSFAQVTSNLTLGITVFQVMVNNSASVTLPLASSVPAGKMYSIKAPSLSSTGIFIITSGSDTINNTQSYWIIDNAYETVDLYSNGVDKYFARSRGMGFRLNGVRGITGIQGETGIQGTTGVEF